MTSPSKICSASRICEGTGPPQRYMKMGDNLCTNQCNGIKNLIEAAQWHLVTSIVMLEVAQAKKSWFSSKNSSPVAINCIGEENRPYDLCTFMYLAASALRLYHNTQRSPKTSDDSVGADHSLQGQSIQLKRDHEGGKRRSGGGVKEGGGSD